METERSDLEKRRSIVLTAASDESAIITDSLLQSLAQADLEEELLAEREQGIIQIHQDVINLRGLFTQVALHVDQQGVLLDNIESNIESTAQQAQGTAEELRTTLDTNYNSSRLAKCPLILLLLLLVFGGLVALR